MPNRILLTGLIILGIVAIIIALNYYYNYHPIRPFHRNAEAKNGILALMIQKTTHKLEVRDHQLHLFNKTMMVVGKFKTLKFDMGC
jgi:hypothetical protein